MQAARTLFVLIAVSLFGVAGCGGDDGPVDQSSTANASTSVTLPEQPSASFETRTVEVNECPAGGCEIEHEYAVPYARDATADEQVDILRPAQPGPWPLVVVAHGVLGSPWDVMPWAEEIASSGAVAVVVAYPDNPPFVDAVEHLGCSVRFARSIATEDGGDPDKVTFLGHSLGAAMGTVLSLDDERSMDRCLADEGSTTPDALVAYEGPFDIALTARGHIDLSQLEIDDPETWRSVNPYTNLGQHPELVVRLVHGIDNDTNWYDLPPDVSEAFYQALLDAGYDVELVLVEGATHGSIERGSAGFEQTVALVMEVARS